MIYCNGKKDYCDDISNCFRDGKFCDHYDGTGFVETKTNADRIRAMTDEELAEFLDKCEARGYQDSSIARDASDHCIDMIDWLQQPCGGDEQC